MNAPLTRVVALSRVDVVHDVDQHAVAALVFQNLLVLAQLNVQTDTETKSAKFDTKQDC
jgi:hypothetical protein